MAVCDGQIRRSTPFITRVPLLKKKKKTVWPGLLSGIHFDIPWMRPFILNYAASIVPSQLLQSVTQLALVLFCLLQSDSYQNPV